MRTQDIKRSPRHSAHAAGAGDMRIKTADQYTVRELLRIRMGVGQSQEGDEPGEYYWGELLKGCAEADVLLAAWAHYRHKSRQLWPADVLTWVRHEAQQRRERAHESRERAITLLAETVDNPDALEMWTRILDEEVGRGAAFLDAVSAAECAIAEANLGMRIPETIALDSGRGGMRG